MAREPYYSVTCIAYLQIKKTNEACVQVVLVCLQRPDAIGIQPLQKSIRVDVAVRYYQDIVFIPIPFDITEAAKSLFVIACRSKKLFLNIVEKTQITHITAVLQTNSSTAGRLPQAIRTQLASYQLIAAQV